MNIRKMVIITAIREAERRLGEGNENTCARACDILEIGQNGSEALEVSIVYAGLYAHNLELHKDK